LQSVIGVFPRFHTVMHGDDASHCFDTAQMPPSTSSPAARRAKSAAPAEPTRATLTPDTWIEAATEVLVDQGIDHVRVDVLAGELGVTRGSFYWHFRDREDLLRRVLQAWHDQATEQLTRRLERARDDARAQLADVISLPFRGRAAARAARIELAIRAWARRDAMARRAVDEADASRIACIAQIFSSLGFAPLEARSRAFLLYAYVVGESLMATQGGPSQKEERRRLVERLVQLPLAEPAASVSASQALNRSPASS
jgi:AcrR family transcriptional regulator